MLELNEFDRRANHYAGIVRMLRAYNQTTISTDPTEIETQEDLSATVGSLLGVSVARLFVFLSVEHLL